MTDKCQDCKYKEFYERYKFVEEYVEREAEKKLNKWLKEGKLRRKRDVCTKSN